MLPRDRWEHAGEACKEGADDVVLTPCSLQVLVTSALVACEAVRNGGPAPYHRPRVALREALEHPSGGEVIVRSRSGVVRILVSGGRVVWVHDDADRGALVQRLSSFGIRLHAEEIEAVVAECRRTREHFAEVVSRWGLADAEAVMGAIRALIDGRLRTTLSRRHSAALFIPARWSDPANVAFSTEELELSPVTIFPPSREMVAGSRVSLEPALRARCELLVDAVHGSDGCVVAVALHSGASTIVSQRGEAERLSVAWSLGAALELLDDPRADALVVDAGRCHLARRVPGDPDCLIYAAYDLAATSLGLARLSFATHIDRFCRDPIPDHQPLWSKENNG